MDVSSKAKVRAAIADAAAHYSPETAAKLAALADAVPPPEARGLLAVVDAVHQEVDEKGPTCLEGRLVRMVRKNRRLRWAVGMTLIASGWMLARRVFAARPEPVRPNIEAGVVTVDGLVLRDPQTGTQRGALYVEGQGGTVRFRLTGRSEPASPPLASGGRRLTTGLHNEVGLTASEQGNLGLYLVRVVDGYPAGGVFVGLSEDGQARITIRDVANQPVYEVPLRHETASSPGCQ